MLNNALSVTFAGQVENVPNALITKTRTVVENVLRAHGFGGIWRMNMIKRQPLNTKEFSARSIFEAGPNNKSIKIWTMIGDRDGSWESLLHPPSNYDAENVFAAIRDRSNAMPPPKPIQAPAPQPEAILTRSLPQLQTGMTFNGTITKIVEYGCFVQLYPNIEGLCHISNWDYKRTTDMHRVCKVGDEVKVMVVKIDHSTGKMNIGLSRKDAFESKITNIVELMNSFSGIPDKDGYLSLVNFTDDDKRLMLLLEAIAMIYPTCKGKPYFCRYVPKNMVWNAWEEAIKKQYHAKSISKNIYPFMKTLIKKGLVDSYNQDGDTIGYFLTARGWDSVGGPLAVDLDPKLIVEELSSKHRTSKYNKTLDEDKTPRTWIVEKVEPPKIVPKPVVQESKPAEFADVIKYAETTKRLAKIDATLEPILTPEITALIEERDLHKQWLLQHQDLHDQYLKLKEAMA